MNANVSPYQFDFKGTWVSATQMKLKKFEGVLPEWKEVSERKIFIVSIKGRTHLIFFLSFVFFFVFFSLIHRLKLYVYWEWNRMFSTSRQFSQITIVKRYQIRNRSLIFRSAHESQPTERTREGKKLLSICATLYCVQYLEISSLIR